MSKAKVKRKVEVVGPVATTATASNPNEQRVQVELRDAEGEIDHWIYEASGIDSLVDGIRLLAEEAAACDCIDEVRAAAEATIEMSRYAVARLRALQHAMDVATMGDGLDGVKVQVEVG